MERALTPDEKLRRAEELYFQRRGTKVNQNTKTVSVPVSNRRYVLRKMIIQLVVCFLIYTAYYIIKNYNFIFSKEVVDKTNQVLSYDVDIKKLYTDLENYINNQNKKTEDNTKEQNENQVIEENEETGKIETPEVEVSETIIDTVVTAKVVEEKEEEVVEEKILSQMEISAKEIKEKYLPTSPLKGQITYRFGPRTKTVDFMSEYHLGIDIAANVGTAIVASVAGKVIYSGELGGYGNCVEIQTDDVITLYGHCSKLCVKVGDVIKQGQKIAEVGSTGNSTGPHLHFEFRKAGECIDPSLII